MEGRLKVGARERGRGRGRNDRETSARIFITSFISINLALSILSTVETLELNLQIANTLL